MNETLMDCSTAAFNAEAPQANILLVEDDERARHALYLFLQHANFVVICAGSVAEAEKYLTEMGQENFAAIITDMNLDPIARKFEGYAFFQRWQAKHPDLAFILVSGDPGAWDLPAIRSRDVCFLAKPFNFGDLLVAVQSSVKERSATSLLPSR